MLIDRSRISPGYILGLNKFQVVVVESDLEGTHNKGYAVVAKKKFGAMEGESVGHQGQAYMIPTFKHPFATKSLPIKRIRAFVEQFILYAGRNPMYKFIVTEIGTGVAGYKASQIAPLFLAAVELENVSLPKSFWDHIIKP